LSAFIFLSICCILSVSSASPVRLVRQVLWLVLVVS
jgi:hypothetical protein